MIHLRVISSPTFDMELLPTLERYTSGLSRHSENVRKFYFQNPSGRTIFTTHF